MAAALAVPEQLQGSARAALASSAPSHQAAGAEEQQQRTRAFQRNCNCGWQPRTLVPGLLQVPAAAGSTA